MELYQCLHKNWRETSPEPLRAYEKLKENVMEKLTDVTKEMQQTELLARRLVQLEVPVHPFLLNITNTGYMVTKLH